MRAQVGLFQAALKEDKLIMDSRSGKPLAGLYVAPFDFEELRRTLAVMENRRKAVGAVNPRASGLHNRGLQLFKNLLARALHWYTRPLKEFNTSVAQSLVDIYSALEHLSANIVVLDERLAQEQLELLHAQVRALVSLEHTASEGSVAATVNTGCEDTRTTDSDYPLETRLGNDRTTYILGLFGTGRLYLNELILQNIGERAKYFRDGLRLYPGPTSMICSGHITMKYLSRDQTPPAIMARIVEAVKARFADSIFVYRHPLDSLLTNWIYWRTYVRDNRTVCGITDVYQSSDDLLADLDRNFFEFKAFADGDPDFYLGLPGPRFLSFPEFVEETALHCQVASLTLRLEDFMSDPANEFSKVTDLMSVDLDLRQRRILPPRSKPYRFLSAKEQVPRFKRFIDGMNIETKRRIERLGYSLGD